MVKLEDVKKRLEKSETREAGYREEVEALRKEVKKYGDLLNESSDPFFSFLPEGRYHYVNKAFAEGVGRKQDEIIGKTIWDIFPKDEADQRYAAVKWVFENGQTRVIEVRVPRPDGDRYYLTTVKPTLNSEGRVISALCVSKEITDRKRTEDQLRESKERYRTILENIEDGYYEVDLTGNFLFVNESFLKITGYSGRDITGKNFKSFCDPQDVPKVWAAYQQVFQTGKPVKRFEWEYTGKGKNKRLLEISISLIKNLSGASLGFRGVVRDATDRIEAEQALKRSEKRYRDIFENAVEGIFQSTPEGKYLRVNPAMARMSGYTGPEEMIRSITNIGTQVYVHPEDRLRFKEELDRDGIIEGLEVEVYRKDGGRMWVSLTARAIRDESGKIIYFEGTVENITERKRIERKFTELNRLREQLIGPKNFGQKLKIITDGLVHIFEAEFARIWMVNPGDRCRECLLAEGRLEGPSCHSDLSCLHLLAGSGEDTYLDGLGHSPVDLGSYKIGRIACGKIIKFVTNNVLQEAFIRNRQWAADRGLVSFAGFQLLSAEGGPLGVMALFGRRTISADDEILMEGLANSTAQVIQTALIEDSLKESEERYRTAIEHSYDGFALVRDERFLYVNQKMCEIFGYDRPEDMIGQPIGLIVHADDQTRVLDMYRRRSRGETVPARYEAKGRRKNGEPAEIEVSVSQTLYKGEPVALAYLRDITDRKKADEERRILETRMQEVQKLESLGVLAGGIAHDFNNLLMAILGNADLALFTLSPASPARLNIEEILRASQRAADLCRQMLAYSGKGRFVVGRYNLGEIIQEMTQMLEVSISKKAALRFAFAEGLPAVEVDATQIRQVVMNLITNASESLGERSGTISIACGVRYCDRAYLADSYMDDHLPEGKYVFLKVSDTGAGMNEETQRRIFEPFYSTKFTGRGLGLAAVLGIVRGHKGAIKVRSAFGEGTTFTILLPALDEAASKESEKKQETGSIREGALILLVDDDYHVRKVGTEMLTRLGFKVLTAEDGREGLETLRTHKDDVECVILDLSMPEMGGEEALGQFLLLKSDLPVVLSSGYNEQDVSQRFNLQGVAGFIQKPYTIMDMRETLKRVLGG